MSKIISAATTLLVLAVAMVPFTSDEALAAAKHGARACEKFLHAASAAENVPIGLLYAVALTETGSNGELNPFALNIEGKTFLATSKSEALAAFEEARENNRKLIDLGCMQINYHYHHESFLKVEDMLDPKQNVSYAAKLLKSLKKKHGTWTEAVARYHAGSKNKVAQHRYVCRVLTHMVATNFGSWTAEAQAYCRDKPQ